MVFNEKRLAGLAKIADNVATAIVVIAVVGGVAEHRFSLCDTAALIAIAVVLAGIGMVLKKGDGDE